MAQLRHGIDKGKLMTVREVADLLGKSKRTVQRMVRAGDFAGTIRAGDYSTAPVLIPGAAVIAYIESKKE